LEVSSLVLTREHVTGLSTNGSGHEAPDWTPLYRIGGLSAALAALTTPIAITVFALLPPPYDEGAVEWFELLIDNPVLGLVSLDLLFVVVNVLMIPVMLGLYVALRRTHRAVMTLAIVTFFVGLAAFLSTNPSLGMLSLSDRYADAATDVQRVALIGAGEGLMASFEGTAFHVNYILAQLAGIAFGIVILRSGAFTRTIGWLLVVGNAIGFGLYVPVVGLGLSALSGVVLWVWLILLARSFLQMARADPVLATEFGSNGQGGTW
jgi:hypothetical protein